MRARSFFISTLKEAPADADVVSQQYMIRAGMIKKLAAGVYTYMPMGLRVIRKIEGIIREEMNRAGAVELLMPIVQPAELWMETGRWDKYGPELLRIKDRHNRDFVIQPTSEEVVTDVARQEIKSWRQLPVNFWHIQTKFRDERRPRFGVMRGREFTIKDAYSFYKSNISNEIKVPLSTFLKEVNENYTKSENVPLLDLATIPSNSLICYLPENSSKLDTNKKVMKEGNILFGSIRPYLKKCIISPFDGVTTGTVIQWKVKNEEMKCFILGVLLSNEFFDFAISNSTGTKMPVVKSADLLHFPVIYDECQIKKFYSKAPVQYDLIIRLLKENYSLSKLKTDLLNNLIA